jgi:hypothetical protein
LLPPSSSSRWRQIAPSAHLCIEAHGNNSSPTQCQLAGNSVAAELAAVKFYDAKSGAICDATRIRGIGHNTKSTVIEAECSSGAGFVLLASNPLRPDQPVKAVDCMSLAPKGAIKCQLTDPMVRLRTADSLMRQAQPTCQVTAHRFIGSTNSDGRFFEMLCHDGKGFMLKQSATGAMAGIAACTDAAATSLGGCTLGQPSMK